MESREYRLGERACEIRIVFGMVGMVVIGIVVFLYGLFRNFITEASELTDTIAEEHAMAAPLFFFME
jgi:hypothetical protein